MKTNEIRKHFLEFFKAKGHTLVKSDSLIPKNDPTLLFTGAGMNQFKDYFLGARTNLKRATSSQKCLRTGDLDQVGKTPYHHSFFEMLGNFSFGDYFKEEAIAWAWEFLTQEMQLPKEKLFVSVYEKDDEAFQIWTKKIKIPEKLIARLGDHTNFWPADAPKLGPNGPCGPCSEIYFDQGNLNSGNNKKFWADDESGRYAEIWNLVFTQFDRKENGALAPLKSKNIDTGMGLERLACVIQGKRNNFEIDIFESLLAYLTGKCSKDIRVEQASLNAIADHVRAAVVAISDGAHPSNEGRGYVIRKLIRRAVWRGRMGELKFPLLPSMVSLVVKSLEQAYPELKQSEKSVEETIASEETRFQETLESGLNILNKFVDGANKRKKKILSGEEVFRLYDTYGFPDELTRIIAKDAGIEIDEKGFEELLEEQRKRAKESTKLSGAIFVASEVNQELLKLPETVFLGYETLEAESQIVWCNFSGEEGAVVLKETPFYPEGGGQVGDIGIIESKNFQFLVSDTQKKERVTLHYGKLISGTPKVGDKCMARVDSKKRAATKRNHTATHLLQAALRTVLGTHIRQVGSLVNPEKLRFDFTHGKPLTAEEIKKVEEWVNETVLESTPVQAKVQSYEKAMKEGVLAFFGDKYGDQVRTIEVPGRSKELCGGTHCHVTGEIGAFVIVSETSVGSGARRIEALTGLNTVQYLKGLQEHLNQICNLLKVPPVQAEERIKKLQEQVREFEKGSSNQGAGKQAAIDFEKIVNTAQAIGKINFLSANLPDLEISDLRRAADELRKKTKQSVLALFSKKDLKVNLIMALTPDLNHSTLDAKELAEAIALHIEGSAGGRKDLAQGGGRNGDGIKKALNALPELIRKSGGDLCK